MAKQRLFASLAALIVLAVLSSACGAAATPTSEGETPSEGPAPQETPAPVEETLPPETEAAPVEAEIPENVGTHAVPASMPSMDPDYMMGWDHQLGFAMYETLTFWTPDGLQPKLATSWESNEDGTEWTFHLREGVTFHDGTPFTADAVKFSYERTIEAGLASYYFDVLTEIDVVDDHTVVLRTSEPNNMPLIVSAGYGMFIVNPNVADKPEGWFEEGNDAGTGPYMIETYEPGSRWVLTRYDDYWGGWEPGQFTKLVYLLVEDQAVREQMIRSGEADVTSYIPWESYDSLEATGEITVNVAAQLLNYIWMFHLDNPPMDNLKLRQALIYAFPFEQVQQSTYGGKAAIAKGVAPAVLWDPPQDLAVPGYDLERARALLTEAGVGDGLELRLAYATGNVNARIMAELWQAELAKIGINLTLQEISAAARWDVAFNPDNEYHILGFPWAPGYPSFFEFGILYHSTYTTNPSAAYANETYDALLMQGRAAEATDMDEAKRLYAEAQQILFDDAVGVFALDYPMDFVYRNDVAGLQPDPPYWDIVFWYDLRRTQP